jgi:hypothetical protein
MSTKNLNRVALNSVIGLFAAYAAQSPASAATSLVLVQPSTSGTYTKTVVTPAKALTTPTAPATTTPTTTTPTTTPTTTTPTTTPTTTAPTTTPVAITTPSTTTPASTFGTYYKPFAATSLWNSRPVTPLFGTFVIPKSSYFPAIANGAYSTGAFLAQQTDAPMVVYPRAGQQGVWNPDTETWQASVTIPHWPASTLPATGTDGHADIVDTAAGVIHSFWQLKQVDGKWVAQLYSWMPLAGRGFADPAHYYQGARAVGIPASAGLIRTHEINDGLSTYEHALAMSLTYNGLAASPTYVYPATSADSDAATTNTGGIPEGALLMLPSTYDTSKIASPALKKVAETLKKYGAYVVDRNVGTPFVIYVENGSGFKMSDLAWDNAVAAELDRIRANLRRVTGATQWIDGNGNPTASPLTAPTDMNALSMRGPWTLTSGPALGTFDTLTQMLQFPATTTTRIGQTNSNGRGLTSISWGKRVAGTTQRLTIKASNGAGLRMTVYNGGAIALNTGNLYDGQSVRFVWPAGGWIVISAFSGLNGTSAVGAELVTVAP